MAETLRAALNELATIVPDWVRDVALESWYKRYGSRIEDSWLPASVTERDVYAQTVGEDIDYLLECLKESNLSINWRELPSIIALQLVWQHHYEIIIDESTEFKQVRCKLKRELARAAEGIESPYDIEARYRIAVATGFAGLAIWCI